MRITFALLKGVTADCCASLLLFIGKNLGDQLCTELLHAQIFGNNVMHNTFKDNTLICQHSEISTCPLMSLHFSQNVMLTGVRSGLRPRRHLCTPGTSCASVAVNRSIIAISFPRHGNGLDARFLECNTKLYHLTQVLETRHPEIPTSH